MGSTATRRQARDPSSDCNQGTTNEGSDRGSQKGGGRCVRRLAEAYRDNCALAAADRAPIEVELVDLIHPSMVISTAKGRSAS